MSICDWFKNRNKEKVLIKNKEGNPLITQKGKEQTIYLEEIMNHPEFLEANKNNPTIMLSRFVFESLNIGDKIRNELIKKYPKKIIRIDITRSINKSKKEAIFEGEFNISKEREELPIKIIINGKEEECKAILIKKPHLKEYEKLKR